MSGQVQATKLPQGCVTYPLAADRDDVDRGRRVMTESMSTATAKISSTDAISASALASCQCTAPPVSESPPVSLSLPLPVPLPPRQVRVSLSGHLRVRGWLVHGRLEIRSSKISAATHARLSPATTRPLSDYPGSPLEVHQLIRQDADAAPSGFVAARELLRL